MRLIQSYIAVNCVDHWIDFGLESRRVYLEQVKAANFKLKLDCFRGLNLRLNLIPTTIQVAMNVWIFHTNISVHAVNYL